MNNLNSMEFTGYPSIDKPWLKYYNYNNTQIDPKLNLVDYIKQKNCGRENLTANIYYGKKTTYREMYNQIDYASKALKYIGVKKGERIFFLLPIFPEPDTFGLVQLKLVQHLILLTQDLTVWIIFQIQRKY